MSYQSDIYDALVGDESLAAIVGDRVFSDVADGSTIAPYLVYQTISVDSETTHDGDRSLESALVQITAWATTRAQAISIAKAVCAAVEGDEFRFSNQITNYDEESRLYGEIIQIRGVININ